MTQKNHSVTGFVGLIITITFLFLPALPGSLWAQQSPDPVLLRFIHREGDILHADALVREQVLIDGYYSHDAEINESSVSRVLRTYPDGSADLESEFITDEWIVGDPGFREWLSSEKVELNRMITGAMQVPDSAARPVLRDIPVFPEYPVIPGDTWTAGAEEVHVFRIGGTTWGPYRGDLVATYIYESEEWVEDTHLARIGISYDLYLPIRRSGEPVRMLSGTSSQTLYWDIEAGQPYLKDENFEFMILMTDGRTQEITGAQTVVYRRLGQLDADEVIRDLREIVEDDVDIRAVEDGVLLTLDESEQVLFSPESARVSSSQQVQLQRLARILEDYSDRDILVTGHTADFGTPEGRNGLSLERARAVAGILFPDGRIGPGKLYIRGRGAEEPAGGDAENRRVEILILD